LCDVNYTMPITSWLCLQGTLWIVRIKIKPVFLCVSVCGGHDSRGHHQDRLQSLVVTRLDRQQLTHAGSVAWLFHCSRFIRSISS
jgi:hypothetical protein